MLTLFRGTSCSGPHGVSFSDPGDRTCLHLAPVAAYPGALGVGNPGESPAGSSPAYAEAIVGSYEVHGFQPRRDRALTERLRSVSSCRPNHAVFPLIAPWHPLLLPAPAWPRFAARSRPVRVERTWHQPQLNFLAFSCNAIRVLRSCDAMRPLDASPLHRRFCNHYQQALPRAAAPTQSLPVAAWSLDTFEAALLAREPLHRILTRVHSPRSQPIERRQGHQVASAFCSAGRHKFA